MLLTACGTATPHRAASVPVRTAKAEPNRPAIASKRPVARAEAQDEVAASSKKPVRPPAKKPAQTAKRTETSVAPVVSAAMKNLRRPVAGPVIRRFDGTSNKGIDFAGAAGDPVVAARDGKVVFSSSTLRGYGQLVMIKHDATYVTAYAHNSKVLVKEGQTVKRGQEIARMGSSDTDRVKLHFEVRQNGKAVDPAAFLAGD